MNIEEQVFGTLTGLLVPEYALDWVENICVPGQPCYDRYRDMLDAYGRLCGRLGVVNEDPDAEVMVNALLDHGKILALKMFEYGQKYGRMQLAQEDEAW